MPLDPQSIGAIIQGFVEIYKTDVAVIFGGAQRALDNVFGSQYDAQQYDRYRDESVYKKVSAERMVLVGLVLVIVLFLLIVILRR